MKKLLLVFILILLPVALAEPARDYAAWLEEALPGAAFEDAAVPDFCIELLGQDYEFIAREDARYGAYIAGVRRDSAPRLSENARSDNDGSTFQTRIWRVVDGEEEIYRFVMGEGVHIRDYDQLQHLLIFMEADGNTSPFLESDPLIQKAASASGRALLDWRHARGFVNRDASRPQLCLMVHSIDTWRAGVTDQPSAFYLDVEVPGDLYGARSIEGERAIHQPAIDLGVYLYQGENSAHFVTSTKGVKAVRSYSPGLLREAGPGFDALLDQAEAALGYRPGPPDFSGKTSVRASFEWVLGEDASGNAFGPGARTIEDPSSLQKLDKAFRAADFTVGSVNCPAPAFLTLEYSDGSSLSIAVAINSFDLFFYNGVCFTAGEGADFIEMFGLQGMNFYTNR